MSQRKKPTTFWITGQLAEHRLCKRHGWISMERRAAVAPNKSGVISKSVQRSPDDQENGSEASRLERAIGLSATNSAKTARCAERNAGGQHLDCKKRYPQQRDEHEEEIPWPNCRTQRWVSSEHMNDSRQHDPCNKQINSLTTKPSSCNKTYRGFVTHSIREVKHVKFESDVNKPQNSCHLNE